MFDCQGNYWIWILIAFFLLSGSGGCGSGIGNIFGCGGNSWWIILLVAFFLLGNKGIAC